MSAEVAFRALPVTQDDVQYSYGPDSIRQPEVGSGRINRLVLDDSRIYPGTTRTIWVHTSSGHDSDAPAAVMFFNDGWWYLDPEGDVCAGIVLDNLAHQRAVPALIGVFVDPGTLADSETPKNRNAEYDAFDDRYARFLCDEVLPLVAELHSISPSPDDRGICGGSSGGNAAFTTAWQRSDSIRRVITFNASFAQMPGGNPYPALIPNESAKPLRVLVHAAHRDLGWNGPEQNWFAENLDVAAALARAGYDFRLVLGDGGHSPNHGGVLLPDALRWLWR